MATNVTVRDLVDKYSLDEELLDKEFQSNDLLELGRFCDLWKLIGEQLGLPPEQINAIDCDRHTTEEKRVAMLQKWKQKFAFKATYRKLTETLLSCERADIAQRVCEHLAMNKGQPPRQHVHERMETDTQPTHSVNPSASLKQLIALRTTSVNEQIQARELEKKYGLETKSGGADEYHESMSIEDFFIWLESEGVEESDLHLLRENKINAKNLKTLKPQHLERLKLSIGGEARLEALLKEITVDESPSESQTTSHKIDSDLIIFTDKKLGSGRFGSVFEGSIKGEPCAVKVLHSLVNELKTSLPVANDVKKQVLERFWRECEFLESTKHEYVVQHIATRIHPQSNLPVLALELLDCSLTQYLCDTKQCLPTETQLSLSRNITTALEFLHSKNIVHRDLCSDNILLKLSDPIPIAKVADFGMLRIIDCNTHSRTLTAMADRVAYLPSEAMKIEATHYDSSVDVFMFGVVMVQIIQKTSEIDSVTERHRLVKAIPADHPLKASISECLSENPKLRPKATSDMFEQSQKRKRQQFESQQHQKMPPPKRPRITLTLPDTPKEESPKKPDPTPPKPEYIKVSQSMAIESFHIGIGFEFEYTTPAKGWTRQFDIVHCNAAGIFTTDFLHISIRGGYEMVLNTSNRGPHNWEREVRPPGYPVIPGQKVTLRVKAIDGGFKLTTMNGFYYMFEYRQYYNPLLSANFIFVGKDYEFTPPHLR